MSATVSPPRVPTTATVPVAADVVVALLSVNGATAAAERHGDVAMIAALQTYYGQVATALARAEGEVVKVMGDGVLVTFPRAGAREAVAALCLAQREANAHWQAFDAGCTVVVRATAGPVLRVALGPPGAERPDVYGATLNALWRLPVGELSLSPALTAHLDA